MTRYLQHLHVLGLTGLAWLAGCAVQDADSGTEVDTHVAEVTSSCGPALAIHGVSASGAQDGNPPDHVIDGDSSTRWSQNGVGSFITLDLGAATPVCNVRIAWYQGATRTNKFTIGFSSDGASFTQALSATSSGATDQLETYAAATPGARFVRVTVNGNSANTWASINEIAVSGTGFVHPGILVSRAQLDFVKAKVAAGAQPWKAAFDRLKASRLAQPGWTAKPIAVVQCGPHSGPDIGCSDEMNDAIAAYSNALLWYYTGQTQFADKAIQIMNAWSAVLKDHAFDTTTFTNGLLQAGWAGEVFPRAAEIIRSTSTRWPADQVQRFQAMLRTAFLPRVIDGWPGGGNWNTTMAEATINIGIFNDDRATFDRGVSNWRVTVESLVYLTSDGPTPHIPLRSTSAGAWWGAKMFIQGLEQETCRDLSHTVMGLAGAVNAAETARIQGLDLYAAEQTRLIAGFELQAQFLNTGSIPTSLCPNGLVLGGTGYQLSWEIFYNHYHGRLGVSLPQSRTFIATIRPTAAALHMDWETLTHGVGSL